MTVVNSTIADNQAGGYGRRDLQLWRHPDGGQQHDRLQHQLPATAAVGSTTQWAAVTLDNTIVAENNLNGDGDDLDRTPAVAASPARTTWWATTPPAP